MNRLLVLVVLVAAPFALADEWNKKVSDFYGKQAEARKKLGLDKDTKKLKADYPTPEVKFGGGAAACVLLCPGATATVKLDGRLPANSLVLPESDDVEVVNESLTPKGWEATLKAKPTASPRRVSITALSAVSAIRGSAEGLEIGCKYTLVLDVKGGDSVTLKPDFTCGGREQTVPGEWKRGDKVMGSLSYRVTSNSSGVSVVLASQDDLMKLMQGVSGAMNSPQMKELNKRSDEVSKKFGACGKLPPDKMGACFAGPQAEMQKINKERDALMAEGEKKASLAFGCGELNLNLKDGKIDGDAEKCSGRRLQERLNVTGRYASP